MEISTARLRGTPFGVNKGVAGGGGKDPGASLSGPIETGQLREFPSWSKYTVWIGTVSANVATPPVAVVPRESPMFIPPLPQAV